MNTYLHFPGLQVATFSLYEVWIWSIVMAPASVLSTHCHASLEAWSILDMTKAEKVNSWVTHMLDENILAWTNHETKSKGLMKATNSAFQQFLILTQNTGFFFRRNEA